MLHRILHGSCYSALSYNYGALAAETYDKSVLMSVVALVYCVLALYELGTWLSSKLWKKSKDQEK